MSELDTIRAEVAATHGLDERAVSFITGSNLAEIESSASALAKLVGTSGVRRAEAPIDPIAAGRQAQADRKRALLASFAGQASQPRDEAGRFAARGGFDGGARSPLPTRGDPEADHSMLIGGLAAASRGSRGPADLGRHF